jgi:hypothetical protein
MEEQWITKCDGNLKLEVCEGRNVLAWTVQLVTAKYAQQVFLGCEGCMK